MSHLFIIVLRVCAVALHRSYERGLKNGLDIGRRGELLVRQDGQGHEGQKMEMEMK